MKKSFMQKWNCSVYLIVCLIMLNALPSILGGVLYVRLSSSFPNISINDQQVQIDTSGILLWYEEELRAARWEIAQNVSSEYLEDTVSYLSETIGARVTGTDKEKQAAQWIQQELEGYGYEVESQEFRLSNRLESQNVIAYKEFRFKVSEETIIIGAHYDTVADSPGAMDNASGVASVLEVARTLSDFKTDCNLVFILFGGEECVGEGCANSLQGSEDYASHLKDFQKLVLGGMINLDMMGEDGEVQIRREAGLSDEFADGIYEAFLDVGLKADVVQSKNWSDHESFEAARIPAVFVFTPGFELGHSPQDTIDTVHFDRVEEISEGVVWYLLNEECGD